MLLTVRVVGSSVQQLCRRHVLIPSRSNVLHFCGNQNAVLGLNFVLQKPAAESIQWCRLLQQMLLHVTVCLSSVTLVHPAKAIGHTDMPFGIRLY